MPQEVPKRLRPTLPTVRYLFAHSGNQCAFPDCDHPLIDQYYNFVAHICHIEAAELGGERFNSAMTNEERRKPENLLLMCHRHHVETDDVDRFPVATMRRIKARHEAQYADGAPVDDQFDEAVRAIVESTIVDLTKQQRLQLPSSLDRWFRWAGIEQTSEELPEYMERLMPLLEALRKLPVDTRGLLLVVVERGDDYGHDVGLPAPEVEHVTRMPQEVLHEHAVLLERYGVLYREEDYDDGLVWLGTRTLGDWGWPFWRDLKKFCSSTDESLDSFVMDLRFDLLD
jgi:hypothetical protein